MVIISMKKQQVDYLIRLIIRSEEYNLEQIKNLPLIQNLLIKLNGNGRAHSIMQPIRNLVELVKRIEASNKIVFKIHDKRCCK